MLLYLAGTTAVVGAVTGAAIYIEEASKPSAATVQQEANKAFQAKVEQDVRAEMRDPESAMFSDVFVWAPTEAACGKVNGRNGFGGYAGDDNFAYHQGRIAFARANLKKYALLQRPCMRARYLSAIDDARQAIAAADASPMTPEEKQRVTADSKRMIAEMEASMADMANQNLPH